MTTEPTTPETPAEPTEPTTPAVPPEPAAPAAPAAPTDAAAPPTSPRRGLPGWAWAIIAGGAALMIAFVVVVVIVVNAVVGGVTASDIDGQPTAAPAPAATSSSAPAETEAPTAKPGGATPTGLTSLDEHVDLGTSFPIWRFPIEDGWEITVFDQQGVNQAQNAEIGCLFTSSQNKQPAYDLDATDDRSDTEASLEALAQQMLASVEEAAVVGTLGSAEIAVTTAGSSDRIEFGTSRVDYVNPQDGQDYTNQIGARAMPLAESFMYYVVSCPTALVEAGNSPFTALGDSLAVVFE